MDKDTEQKIKDAADIVAVIGDFVELNKRGVHYTGICPFHDDHTVGNFLVNSKGFYHCFTCGAGGDSIKFLMEHEHLTYAEALYWLAAKFDIYVDEDYDRDKYKNIKPAKPLSPEDIEPDKEMLVYPRDMVSQTVHAPEGNLFTSWIKSLPWELEQRKRLDRTLWLYCVGSWDRGRVVFWQIDEEARPRGGKIMTYLPDGHRDKSVNPTWIHSQKGMRDRLQMDRYEYRSTLFGMHLTRRYPKAIIHIVESEKTALVCATHYGRPEENLWLACGGLKFLKLEALEPLFAQGRTIYLWPDKDGLEDWQKARNAIVDRYHPTTPLQINTEFLTKNWKPQDGPKADVADIIVRILNEAPILEVLKDHTDGMPFLPQDEINDPDLHRMRQRLRRLNIPAQMLMPTSNVEGVETIGQILQRSPQLKPLFYNNPNPEQTT